MALGDVVVFNSFVNDLGDKVHNLSGDTYKLALITDSVTPSRSTADPRWGSGGSTNLSSDQVTPGGNYSSGGVSLSAVITDNWSTVTSGAGGITLKFDGDDVTILQDSSNPDNARWGIIYNDTDSGKRAVAFVDLGGVVDLTAGDFTITWHSDGIFNVTAGSP